MRETSVQIGRHIQETRNDLSDNFNELEAKVKTAVDWRTQFDKRPLTMMAVAFGGGVVLSALLPSARSPRRRPAEGGWSPPQDRDALVGLPFTARAGSDATRRRPVEMWEVLRGALVGVATSKLRGLVEDLLPGFKQEFIKAQARKSGDRRGSANSDQPVRQTSIAAGAD
jgi:hypothetical protein